MNIRHLKHIILGILCLAIAMVFFFKPLQPISKVPLKGTQSSTAIIESKEAESQTAAGIATPPKEQVFIQQPSSKQTEDGRIAELIKQRLTLEMRAEINAQLNPPNPD